MRPRFGQPPQIQENTLQTYHLAIANDHSQSNPPNLEIQYPLRYVCLSQWLGHSPSTRAGLRYLCLRKWLKQLGAGLVPSCQLFKPLA